MEEEIVSVKGTNGTISVFEDKVTIDHSGFGGFISQGIKGKRTIYIKDLNSIEYKKPTMMANGYLQLIINPELASNQSVGIFGTHLSATKDPNAIILRAFKKKTVADGEAVHEYLAKKLDELKLNNNSSTDTSDADELTKFKKLLDDGTITQDEFNAKKKQILGL